MKWRRDGLNCALKEGCSALNINRKHTHMQIHTRALVCAGRVNGVAREGRRAEGGGPHGLLCPHSHKQSEPRKMKIKLTCCYSILKTHTNMAGFSPPVRGIPGSGYNNTSIFPVCKGFTPLYFFGSVSLRAADCSPVLVSVWLEAVQWLSSLSPVMQLALWSRHSGPFVYWVDQ